ncbi:MAG: VWA domain-containing protein, partial [Acidobacteriota bacterium]|nr:VWA domain-containing protein [Acidobacteriota bacterium]
MRQTTKNSPGLFLKVLAVAGALSMMGWATAQTSVSTPKASAPIQLVALDTIFTDKSNHSVDDIDRNELQVFEDGKAQVLDSLTKETKPVKYAIAIDASLSFRNVFASSLGACKLLIDSNSAGDETALIRFVSSDKITKEQDFTSDKSRLGNVLGQLFLEGGQSAVIDAVYLAVQTVGPEFAGRRAVVLVSDGEDRKSVHTVDELVKLLRENEVRVFVIGVVAQLDNDAGSIGETPRQKAEQLLNRMARETGGRVFFPRKVN